MSLFERTGISLAPTPAQGSVDGIAIDVSSASVLVTSHAAGEAITAVTATVKTLPAYEDRTATIVDATSMPGGNSALVTMSGFVRGVSYLLTVTMTNAAGVSWPWTLGIRCVA